MGLKSLKASLAEKQIGILKRGKKRGLRGCVEWSKDNGAKGHSVYGKGLEGEKIRVG